jgi:hypothetical protein
MPLSALSTALAHCRTSITTLSYRLASVEWETSCKMSDERRGLKEWSSLVRSRKSWCDPRESLRAVQMSDTNCATVRMSPIVLQVMGNISGPATMTVYGGDGRQTEGARRGMGLCAWRLCPRTHTNTCQARFNRQASRLGTEMKFDILDFEQGESECLCIDREGNLSAGQV